jgi:hypothetical protein
MKAASSTKARKTARKVTPGKPPSFCCDDERIVEVTTLRARM